MKITKRPFYSYECQGPCGKIRNTLVPERAIDGWCTICKRNRVDPNQQELFVGIDMAKGEDQSAVAVFDKKGKLVSLKTGNAKTKPEMVEDVKKAVSEGAIEGNVARGKGGQL